MPGLNTGIMFQDWTSSIETGPVTIWGLTHIPFVKVKYWLLVIGVYRLLIGVYKYARQYGR